MKDLGPDPSLPETLRDTAHARSWKDVVLGFGTSGQEGLLPSEAKVRQKQYGPNALKEPPRPGPIRRFLAQFADFLVLILVGAAAVSAFLGEIVDATVIGAIVVLNAIVSLLQEGKAEEALKSLEKLSAPVAKVVRGGQLSVIAARELVPGDLVLLEAGDKVPADIRLIESHSMSCNESSLTGESVPVDKAADAVLPAETALADRVNMAYSGTVVTAGRGRGIVVSTGMDTEMGKIAGAIHSISRDKTPLQRNLERLGKTLGIAVLAICAGIFLLGVLRDEPAMEMFMVAVSLAVAAIPEGLPAVVTVVLAMGVKRMATRNAIIRRLPAVETLGSATVICADKTGTITQNKMAVVSAFAGDRLMVTGDVLLVQGVSASDHMSGDMARDVEVSRWALDTEQLMISLAGAAMANDAMASSSGEDDGFTGDPTEVALVVAAEESGLHKAVLDKDLPRVFEIPFDSDRKRMTTVHELPDGRYLVWLKGAPEMVMPRCGFALAGGEEAGRDPGRDSGRDGGQDVRRGTIDGKYIASLVTQWDSSRKPAQGPVLDRFRKAGMLMAARGIRVIAVAYKITERLVQEEQELESDLTLTGLLGMIDPPRPEAAQAVAKAKQAGVRPVLITGDNPVTALAIARMVGIADENTKSMSGSEISRTEDLDRVLDETGVFGRVSPEHKVDIVGAFRKRGEIVAMTGDGVNDAPALKQADIGIAMGLAGTEVAKEASDMVLADDNFATIVKAIEEGRTIYSNIAKFVVYLLSCNVGEVLTITAAMLMRLPVILRPVHILWLNLVTDSFPALALGFEPSEPNAMKQPPRPPEEPLLTRKRWITVIVQALLIALSTLGMFIYGLNAGCNQVYARTLAFATLATAEVIRAYTARSETVILSKIGVFSNRAVPLGTLASFLLIIAVVQIPGLNRVFSTTPLTLGDWLRVLGFSLIPALGNELRKVVAG
ncbi:MAG: cation-translocating P-type ATPase [Bacillota bacterium]|jgi:Ca2+-transporting ATPase